MHFNPYISYIHNHTLEKVQNKLHFTNKCNRDIIYCRITTIVNYTTILIHMPMK
jgi:hypothetical protein